MANALSNLCLAAGALALAGCADDRVPLEDCEHGLFWAECGGNGEPVLGCDRDTGDCRWFAGGGLTARGHAVSTCPSTNPCCHSGWPFTDFSPDGAVREVAVEQMSLLRGGVIQRRSPNNDVSVLFDLTEETQPRYEVCSLDGTYCEPGSASSLPFRVGSSLVKQYGFATGRWLLEIVPGETLEDWSANLYRFQDVTREGLTPPLVCGDWYSVSSSYALDGTLHLNTEDLSDPEAVHGHFEAVGTYQRFDFMF